MISNILLLELIIGILISSILLVLLIKSIKNKDFDDSKYNSSGIFFDSEDDLTDLVNRENSKKEENKNKDKKC